VARKTRNDETAKRSGRIRRLTREQRKDLLRIVGARKTVNELAEIVALYGAPPIPAAVRLRGLPSDWRAHLRPIVKALEHAAIKLKGAPLGVRTHIARELCVVRGLDLKGAGPFMSMGPIDGVSVRPHGPDALAESEVHLKWLAHAAREAHAGIPRGGRPTTRAPILAREVRGILLRAGIDISTAWAPVLAIVANAAEFRGFNEKIVIATLLRTERRARINQPLNRRT
jgi:hypothetical protein